MSDPNRDETFEVIDTGRQRWDHNAAGDAPPLDLGDQSDGSGRSSTGDEARALAPVPAWQRWGIIAAVFAFGVVAGAYVWHSRGPDITIVAGPVEWSQSRQSSNLDTDLLDVRVLNAGETELIVTGVEIPGWSQPGDDRRSRDREIAPDAWETFTVRARATCDLPPPEDVVFSVETASGTRQVSVRTPESTAYQSFMRECSGDVDGPTIYTWGSGGWLAADTQRHESQVHISTWLRAGVEITSATVSAPGVRAEAIDLDSPAAVTTEEPHVLTLRWQVIDCEAAATIDELELELDVELVSGRRTESVSLHDSTLFALARFVATECSA